MVYVTKTPRFPSNGSVITHQLQRENNSMHYMNEFFKNVSMPLCCCDMSGKVIPTITKSNTGYFSYSFFSISLWPEVSLSHKTLTCWQDIDRPWQFKGSFRIAWHLLAPVIPTQPLNYHGRSLTELWHRPEGISKKINNFTLNTF